VQAVRNGLSYTGLRRVSESPRCLLLRRLSGNVGKHSLEYFASDFVGVVLWQVLRWAYLAFNGRYSVGRLHFLCNHRKHLNCIVARASCQSNPIHCLEPFRTAVRVPSCPSGYAGQRYAAPRTVAALGAASGAGTRLRRSVFPHDVLLSQTTCSF
jgi:hypothetical protein